MKVPRPWLSEVARSRREAGREPVGAYVLAGLAPLLVAVALVVAGQGCP